MTKQIDYYGGKDNYIHLKFGDARKAYNFTEEFMAEYPQFSKAYRLYWDDEKSPFQNALQVVSYVYNNKIPVHFYFNFTDTPVKDRQEAVDYFIRENDKDTIHEWELRD